MYEASRFAFDATGQQDKAFQAFTLKIYGMLLSYWQVSRTKKPGTFWSSRQVFDTIKREFLQFAWDGSVALPNFGSKDNRVVLLRCLAKMRDIKPHSGFPIMAVSKFLHFYNPAVFPIYDEAVIWNKVLNGRFNRDFSQFHWESGLSYETGDTALWYCNYICYASYLVSLAHPKFMEVFAYWLGKQPGCSPEKWKPSAPKLYATAFEFTIIGAAEAEEAARVRLFGRPQ